ncbi:MAG TPA: phage tail tape measure C-terminal domain-containing protein [Rhizomicrobium sp.]|jgi:phage-related minor tail protein|nr:phage tail tape measure C-terminal domain-containing protein [Rhizomicrobium sp.]
MADNPQAALDDAAKALADFANGPVIQATQTIETAVTNSFDAVARTIARAALSGKLSMDQLVAAILADFDRIAVSQFIVKPIENIVNGFAQSLFGNIGGMLASGGPVAAGETYLVGEQGPELFTPSTSGEIVAGGAPMQTRPSIVVNINTPDAQSFFKSQSQIAALMSRALARGQRNL